MSQLDYLAAQSVARVREHDLQTALRRRHPERRASHAVTAAIVVALAESLVATLVPNGDALRNAVFFALILGTLVYRSWRKT